MRRRVSWSAVSRRLLLAAFATQLTWGVWATGRESWRQLRLARRLVEEDAAAARSRALGAEYVRGLEAVEAAIPKHGRYLAVDAAGDDTMILLQGDLAPRRPRLLARRAPVTRPRDPGRLIRGLPPIVVVYDGPQRPPWVMTTTELARRRPRR